jgi:hypothetical protein
VSADARFKAFRRFNADPPPIHLDSRSRPGDWALDWFASEGMEDRLACALLRARAVPFKEVLEAFEFFERARRHVRGPVVADLCCGHGLVGMLYGVFHRDVHRVLLVDRARPDSVDRTLAALCEVAPWLRDKVAFETADLAEATLPSGAATLGVHACGRATDAVIDLALDAGGPVALLPCCHPKSGVPGPATLAQHLGHDLATDVARTYRLEAAGYATRWTTIPAAITPMNRVVLAWPHAPTETA